MSRTKIPYLTIIRLWVVAGGYCQYEGCTTRLWRDELTAQEINKGLVAHIVAVSPRGPRGDEVRSPMLVKEFSNLMLLCHSHHRLIDDEDVAGHPEARLVDMKRAHEVRIARVTSIQATKKTLMVTFHTPIGSERPAPDYVTMRTAMLEGRRYPLDEEVKLDLTLTHSTERDGSFWSSSRAALANLFEQRVRWRLAQGATHMSVFALAPVPLLIALGKLLSEKVDIDVYQKHRSPPGWSWARDSQPLEYNVSEPTPRGREVGSDVVVVMCISDVVPMALVEESVPAGAQRYVISIDNPRPDCVRQPEDVENFRNTWRSVLTTIRSRHPNNVARIHLVPAIPNSLAVELGRTVLPKVHDNIVIYDRNDALGGLKPAFDL